MNKCSVSDCNNKKTSRGWCNKHYQRWYKNGDPLAQPKHNHGRGNRESFVSYRSAHNRVDRDRGKAKNHDCSWYKCEKRADEWAYNHKDQNSVFDIVNGYKKEYSLNSDFYIALCKRHHEYFDLLYRRNIPLTKQEQIVYH